MPRVTQIDSKRFAKQPQTSRQVPLPNDSVEARHLSPGLLATLFGKAIVGSPSDVANGAATHSTLQDAVDACSTDDRIFILKGSFSGSAIVNKRLCIRGVGHGSQLAGAVTLTSAAAMSDISSVQFGDNLTIQSGCDGVFVKGWLAAGKTLTDNSVASDVKVVRE